MRRHAALPAVLAQEIGHRADRVDRAVDQVHMAVAIEVDREAPPAARHELAPAHRAGVRALHRHRIQAVLARQDQELAQLLAEEGAAVARAGRQRRGVVEAQRRQRVQHAEAAHDPAVEGLHADHRRDHFRRHAIGRLRARERRLVRRPEGQPGLQPLRLDEALTVGAPVLRLSRRPRQDQPLHRRLRTRQRQDRAQFLAPVAERLRLRVGEGHDVVAVAIGWRRRGLARRLLHGGLRLRGRVRLVGRLRQRRRGGQAGHQRCGGHRGLEQGTEEDAAGRGAADSGHAGLRRRGR